MHELTSRLAEQYAWKLDGVISTAISTHLNGAPWKIEDMKGRLRIESYMTYPPRPKTLYLDDVPILEIYPPEYETTSSMLYLTGKYRFLKEKK